MANSLRQPPPVWFRVVAGLLVLWGLMGCASFYMHTVYGPKLDPQATQWDYDFFASMPMWFPAVFAAATIGGLAGSVALILRSKLAKPLYIVSLVAVIIQFGYLFVATDLIAHKGAFVATAFPIFIAVVAAFQIWFAGLAQRRGWIS